METVTLSCARRVVAWASLACAALLVTACNSPSSTSVASTASSPASSPAGSPSSAGSPSGPVTGPTPPPSSPSVAVAETGARTFLAEGQDVNGTSLYQPACHSGCPLSGDSTAILASMKWSTWSATEAVGTGIYKLDACNPNCAAGPVYPVATVVTLSHPVKVCSSSGPRWYWTRASFSFPDGLPKALRGDNAPQNPWTFSSVVTAAQQSCGG